MIHCILGGVSSFNFMCQICYVNVGFFLFSKSSWHIVLACQDFYLIQSIHIILNHVIWYFYIIGNSEDFKIQAIFL